MTLKSRMSAEIDVFYNTDEFAETIKYTPVGAAQVSIPALIDYGKGIESEGADDLHTDAMINVKVSDVAVVTPGDEITIGAETWKVLFGRIISDGLEWEITASRINR